MKYLEHAPANLIAKHKAYLAKAPEVLISDIVEKTLEMIPPEARTPELVKKLSRSVQKIQIVLPSHEHYAILGRLITDERMNEIWRKLKKRFLDSGDAFRIVVTLDLRIAKWRRVPQKTARERRAHFYKIAKLAEELRSMFDEVTDFDLYSPVDQMSGEDISKMLDCLQSPLKETDPDWESYTRFYLPEYVRDAGFFLGELGIEAQRLAASATSVGKPNATNAEAHDVLRGLSKYFQDRYGQRLYDASATITAVALGLNDIDPDLARKIIKNDGGTKLKKKSGYVPGNIFEKIA